MKILKAAANVLACCSIMILCGCESLKPAVERTNAYLHFMKDGQKIDTGVVDYRYFDAKTGRATYRFAPRECIRATQKVAKTGQAKTDEATCTEGVIDTNDMLRAGDSVSISLMHAYICDFYETANTPRELSRDFGSMSIEKVKMCHEHQENRAGTRGEIAVMASIFELGEQRKISFQADSIGDKDARMIYYSEDVRESGQSLNLSNLPMYGPVTYHGKQTYLGLFVIEIDGPEVEATGSILRELAKLGSKAYPPASPVLSALSKVGDAFMQSQQDDSIVDYKLVFDGADGISPRTAPLAAGLYVFTRMQNRSEDFDWSRYCLNATTGMLYRLKDGATGTACDKTTGELCKTDTYFTIQVKRNEPALAQDIYQTFQEFSVQGQGKSSELTGLSKALEGLRQTATTTAAFDRARTAIAYLRSPLSTLRRQAQEDLMNALCLGVPEDSTAAETGAEALSSEQVYYLLQRTEAAGALKAPAQARDALQSACLSRQSSWAEVEGFFEAPPDA